MGWEECWYLVKTSNDIDTVFCQRSNLFNFNMYRMIWDIIRFNKEAAKIAADADALEFNESGELKKGQFQGI